MNSDHRHQAISNLAYKLWLTRGKPIGSPDTDWQQAERLMNGIEGESATAHSIDVLNFSADSTPTDSFDDEPTQVSGSHSERDILDTRSAAGRDHRSILTKKSKKNVHA